MMIDGIAEYYKKDLLNSSFLSSYIEETGYQILIIRGLTPSHDDIVYDLFCFLFKDQKIYQYNSEKNDFEQLSENVSIYSILVSLLAKNRNIVQTLSTEIEALEESLYARQFPSHFIDLWFDLRNELSKIDRYYQRLLESLTEYRQSPNSPDLLDASQLQEVFSKIHFTQSKTKDELSRLDSLHHYYDSIKSDRLNKSLFILTIISGLFLPLNLVVGFFGMNTEKLYLAGNENGTNIVALILLGIIVVQLFFIPLFKVLDRFLLRYMLGRIDLYKKLNAKFDKISETFKVD
jgi:magnesium transporter